MANAGGLAGVSSSGGGATGRAPRLPRWTRQEILVLIEGKRVVEGRGRGRAGRAAADAASPAAAGAGAAVEPKWAAVAAYCKRHGVERGPVQCRKRWSNLAADYKKIKEWERAAKESFWAMRNDVRRERRLPGFFDREVFDILDGRARAPPGAGVVVRVDLEEDDDDEAPGNRAKAPPAPAEDVGFDGRRAAGEDGLFSEDDDDDDDDEAPAAPPPPQLPPPPPPPQRPPQEVVVALPISVAERKYEPTRQESSEEGIPKDKQPEQNTARGSPEQSEPKRRRTDDISGEAAAAAGGGGELQSRVVEALDRSSRMVAAQLEAQNRHRQLDREQRQEHASSLLGVLGRLADALGRIADRL